MNIKIINDAIATLENEDTTFDNVSELAMLYIVKDKLENSMSRTVSSIPNEAEDILPAYRKYCEVKTRYQSGKTDEGEVIKSIKLVCKELEDFVNILYTSTDMNKERIHIKETIHKINQKMP